MNTILLGPPGVGKGTQAKRLERDLGLPHVASGDIFRAIRKEDTDLAREVQTYMDRGDYVPDDLTIRLVLDRLRKPDAQRGFILDGFPRTLAQAQALDRELATEGRGLDCVIYLAAPPEVLITRLAGRVICPQCGEIYNLQSRPPKVEGICDVCGAKLERRSDESPDVVRKRLDVFLKQTEPVVTYYRERGKLLKVDGSHSIGETDSVIDVALGLRTPR